jgi:hypothetical protein
MWRRSAQFLWGQQIQAFSSQLSEIARIGPKIGGNQVPNGKPGDHPFTDIVTHKANLYSPLAAALVREIATLADDKSRRALSDMLYEKFNPYDRPDVPALERYLTALRDELWKEAVTRGHE